MELERYYQSFYGEAAKIPAGLFLLWYEKAIAELDRLTSGRFGEVAGDYPMCICDVAEALYTAEAEPDIKSENIDGYSVTYADGEKVKDKVLEVARRYLFGTGLLYRGF